MLADGRTAFVKTRADAGPGEYAAEAAGLRWLAEPGALRTPRVIEVGEDYLALEWIEPGRLDGAGVEELGRGLAATHAAGAPGFGDRACGARTATLGRVAPRRRASARCSLPNEPTADWPSLLCRAAPAAAGGDRPRARRAAGSGCPRGRARVRAASPSCAGPAEPPARLHGDLWARQRAWPTRRAVRG